MTDANWNAGAVITHAVVSLDGFIADSTDDVGPLFDWYFNGDQEISAGQPFKVSQASAPYVRSMWQSIGATVMGRHLSTSPTGGTRRLLRANTW